MARFKKSRKLTRAEKQQLADAPCKGKRSKKNGKMYYFQMIEVEGRPYLRRCTK